MERPGIVDLRDLDIRRGWRPPQIDRLVALAGLAVADERRHQFEPPRVIVVVASSERDWLVRRARPWLDEAEHVVLLREPCEWLDREMEADPEVRELVDIGWREALAGLSLDIIDGFTAEDVQRAIACAIAACERLVPRDPAERGESPALLELPSSPWKTYAQSRAVWRLPDLLDRLERRGRTVVLQIDADGNAIDLNELPPAFELTPTEVRVPFPQEDIANLRPGRIALGRDPFHPVGWRGDRMFFFWSYVKGGRVCFLSANDHDHPCGPAKKLYGYDDNCAVQVSLAPDVSVCAARFEHDVLLTTAVPIAWHHAGPVDVAAVLRDPRRAAFFAQDPTSWRRQHDVDLLDDDARDFAPALVIGPDARVRYALDLTFSVYRVTVSMPEDNAIVAHIGGPDAGYAVFDADHQLVRRGSGRLLGGWFRWATIEDAGWYWREDIASGERMRVCPVEPAPDASAIDVCAIPGTRNVMLVTERCLRVV